MSSSDCVLHSFRMPSAFLSLRFRVQSAFRPLPEEPSHKLCNERANVCVCKLHRRSVDKCESKLYSTGALFFFLCSCLSTSSRVSGMLASCCPSARQTPELEPCLPCASVSVETPEPETKDSGSLQGRPEPERGPMCCSWMPQVMQGF